MNPITIKCTACGDKGVMRFTFGSIDCYICVPSRPNLVGPKDFGIHPKVPAGMQDIITKRPEAPYDGPPTTS